MKSSKYIDIDKLPTGIKNNLPTGAQEIYMSTFNSVCRKYNCQDINSVEAMAHRIAWGAVKQKYETCGDGCWRRKL